MRGLLDLHTLLVGFKRLAEVVLEKTADHYASQPKHGG
jgi:hypothetical protein